MRSILRKELCLMLPRLAGSLLDGLLALTAIALSHGCAWCAPM